MFDHLDTPPPTPGQEVLDAVHGRARQIVRRRRTGIAAVSAAAVLAAVFAVQSIALRDAEPNSLKVVTPSLSPTPVEVVETSATPTVAVTSTPAPVATHEPTVTETTEPPATSEPTPSCGGPFLSACPDGKPGWYYGFSGCMVPDSAPAAGVAPVEGMTIDWSVPASAQAGRSVTGTLTITNSTDWFVRFGMSYEPGGAAGFQAYVLGRGGAGAIHMTDVLGVERVELQPGQSLTREVTVRTSTCADTNEQADEPLPAGSYQATAAISYDGVEVVRPTPSGSPDPSPSASPTDAPGVHQNGTWSATSPLALS